MFLPRLDIGLAWFSGMSLSPYLLCILGIIKGGGLLPGWVKLPVRVALSGGLRPPEPPSVLDSI